MNRLRRNFRFLILIVALGLLGLTLHAPTVLAKPTTYTIESNLWFQGTSTVRDWACKEVPAKGSVKLPQAPESTEELRTILQDVADTALASTLVDVPVNKIRCEQGETMNKHMRNALKAEKHPDISFELATVQVKDSIDTTPAKFKTTLSGDLTIKDTTRSVEIPATLRVTEDGLIRVNGDLPLDMTNYTVEPPTVMWSITVYDDITIHVQADFKPAN